MTSLIRSLLVGTFALVLGTAGFANSLADIRAESLRLEAEKKELTASIDPLGDQYDAIYKERLLLAETRERLVKQVYARHLRLQKQYQEYTIELTALAELQSELRPIWDKIVQFPNQYSSSYRREVRNGLQGLNQDSANVTMRQEAVGRQLDEIVQGLRTAELDVELPTKLNTLNADLFSVIAQKELLERNIADIQKKQKDLLEAFVSDTSWAEPLVVNSLQIDAGDTRYYTGTWGPEVANERPADRACGFEPYLGVQAINDPARDAQQKYRAHIAELEGYIRKAQREIDLYEKRIEEMDERAGEYVDKIVEINTEFAQKYREIADLEISILAMNTVVDVGVVVAEVALTGGAATVARTSAEIGAEQMGRIAARQLRREFGAQVAEELRGQTLDQAKKKFVEMAVARLPERVIREQGMDAIRARAAKVFEDTAFRSVKEYSSKQMMSKAANIKTRKAAVNVANTILPSAPNTAAWRAGSIVLSDGAEAGFDATVALAAYAAAPAMEVRGGNWKRAAGVVRQFGADDLKDIVPKKPEILLGVVGTATKAAFAAGIGLEIDAKTQEASLLMAQGKSLAIVYEKLFTDRLLVKEKLKAAQDLKLASRAHIEAMKKGAEINRRLYIEDDIPLDDPEKSYTLTVIFSDPILAAPAISLGGVALEFQAQGPAGSASWTTELDMKKFIKLGGEQKVTIKAKDAAGRNIDGSPSSLALPKLSEPGFQFYDEIPDECHKVAFDLKWPLRINAENREEMLTIGAKQN